MTNDRPWERELDRLDDFEADGLLCAMQRGGKWGTWCGYVGIGEGHPLFGLPRNHPLKLPPAWFDYRSTRQGYGPLDLFLHAISGAKSIEEACPISLALEVHGGVSYAEDRIPGRKPDGRWWFGFDCGHAGDYVPRGPDIKRLATEMLEAMPNDAIPKKMRDTIRGVIGRAPRGVYRDQQYVVGECQSLASQLVAIVPVITGVKIA